MNYSDSSRPSGTMRERVPESSRKFWLLLNANRWLIAAGITGATMTLVTAAMPDRLAISVAAAEIAVLVELFPPRFSTRFSFYRCCW